MSDEPKKKDQDGKYSTDVDGRTPKVGYYWKQGSKIVDFSIIEPIDGYSEIVDFYVVPAYRKKMVDKNMAFAVFNKHPTCLGIHKLINPFQVATAHKVEETNSIPVLLAA